MLSETVLMAKTDVVWSRSSESAASGSAAVDTNALSKAV